jgi:hypothetical protein
MANDPKEQPEHGSTPAHGAHDDHGHGHGADDHGHGHGHGDDAGEIIPENSPQDFMLTMLLSTGAFVGFVMVFLFMVNGAQTPHLQPNSGPSMYMGGEAPHPPRAGEHAGAHGAEPSGHDGEPEHHDK